jgi:hypothetical protein
MEAGDTTPSTSTNGSGQSPWAAHQAAESSAHPELPVLGALVGGFVFAKIIKAIGAHDD